MEGPHAALPGVRRADQRDARLQLPVMAEMKWESMTTVYEVTITYADMQSDDIGFTRFFERKADALKFALHGSEHEAVDGQHDGAEVIAHEVVDLTTRALYVALLNQERCFRRDKSRTIYKREVVEPTIELSEDTLYA